VMFCSVCAGSSCGISCWRLKLSLHILHSERKNVLKNKYVITAFVILKL
jgi:hypothetical protein